MLSTVAASRTGTSTTAEALTAGYALAFRWGGFILLAGVVVLMLWMPRTVANKR